MIDTGAVVRFFHDVDRQDWAGLRAALTDSVRTDYTSLFGGSVERVAADELLDRWRGLLPGFDATQHLLGPFAPADPPAALAEPGDTWLECNVRAYHRLGSEVWLVAGRYTLGVRDDGVPRIGCIVLHTAYQDGDPGLVERATARAAQAVATRPAANNR